MSMTDQEKNLNVNKKLYEGFLALVSLARKPEQELTVSANRAYEKIKPLFRYPGEMLERHKEQGFTSEEDVFSLLYALYKSRAWNGTDDRNCFVGSQLQDFLRATGEDNKEWGSPYISFLLASMGEDGWEDAKAAAGKLANREFYSFAMFADQEMRDSISVLGNQSEACLKQILALRPDLPREIRTDFPVSYENMAAYLCLETFAARNYTGSSDWREKELSGWKTLVQALYKAYEDCLKEGTAAWKAFLGYGFQKEEIFDINCGPYYRLQSGNCGGILKASLPHVQSNSYIRFHRQVRTWFTARLCAKEPVPEWIKELMERNAEEKLDRKIDGTDIKRHFFFTGQMKKPEDYPCIENKLLLFRLTRERDRHYHTNWLGIKRGDAMYCFFDPSNTENHAFLKRLPEYVCSRTNEIREGESDQKVMLACMDYILNSGEDGVKQEYAALKEKLHALEMLMGYPYRELLLENAAKSNNCKNILYRMFDHGDMEIREYCLFRKNDTSSMEEAFFMMDADRRAIAKEYISMMTSRQAYKALVSICRYAQDQGKDPYLLRGMCICPEELVERMEKRSMDPFLSKEEQKDLCSRSLEFAFRFPDTHYGSPYGQYAASFLCCDNIRALFPMEECREAYEAVIQACIPKGLHDKLEDLFLTEKEKEQKKEQEAKEKEEAAKKEEEKRKKEEEERKQWILKEYTEGITETMDPAGKLYALSCNKIPYGKMESSLYASLMKTYISEARELSFPRKELRNIVERAVSLWKYYEVLSYKELLEILSKLSETRED